MNEAPEERPLHVYRYERLLHWSECDPGGIVFSPHYTRWMIDGVNQMLLGLGIDPHAVVGDERMGLPVLSLALEFRRPPKLHDRLVHEIRVLRLGTKSLAFGHRVYRGEECLMEAKETRVWGVHPLTDATALRAVEIPAEVRAALGG